MGQTIEIELPDGFKLTASDKEKIEALVNELATRRAERRARNVRHQFGRFKIGKGRSARCSPAPTPSDWGTMTSEFQVLAYRHTRNLGDAIQTVAMSRLLPGRLTGVYRHRLAEAGRMGFDPATVYKVLAGDDGAGAGRL